jgi:hypothetical protein
MAVMQYEEYILTCTVHPTTTYFGLWFPYATASWRDESGWRCQEFHLAGHTFRTKEEAREFGFATARDWVAHRKRRRRSRSRASA